MFACINRDKLEDILEGIIDIACESKEESIFFVENYYNPNFTPMPAPEEHRAFGFFYDGQMYWDDIDLDSGNQILFSEVFAPEINFDLTKLETLIEQLWE